jgi:predicted DNA-binding transcriptional regulator AlpA
MYGKVLSSWKEISTYTGYSERTLQRWEKSLGFPVRRPAGMARGAVIALSAEIDTWLTQAPMLKNEQSESTASSRRDVKVPGLVSVPPSPSSPASPSLPVLRPSAMEVNECRPSEVVDLQKTLSSFYSEVSKYMRLVSVRNDLVSTLRQSISGTRELLEKSSTILKREPNADPFCGFSHGRLEILPRSADYAPHDETGVPTRRVDA